MAERRPAAWRCRLLMSARTKSIINVWWRRRRAASPAGHRQRRQSGQSSGSASYMQTNTIASVAGRSASRPAGGAGNLWPAECCLVLAIHFRARDGHQLTTQLGGASRQPASNHLS
jgi:hypothetical protein